MVVIENNPANVSLR